ncbi:MAG: MFS transporter [Rhodospirillales bacterium]|jgi:predicted MFS family arabinose efflux permease|nr:MFS transporter [Rhodospirillales bacterium]MDP6642670.1 MFS transporter [Rhodospirillales bacterium]MDP6840183.1 MFS transporter [Rhodospirillales bacterium]
MSRKAIFVIFCGCLIIILANGTRQSFGLFLSPVSRDLGLDFQIFSLSVAVQNLIIGLAQPFVAAYADRFGTARTVAVCGILYSLGMLTLANTGSAFGLHVGAGLMIGLAASGTGFTLVLGAVGRVVSEQRRSFALGLVVAFGSFGQMIAAPLNQQLIGVFNVWNTFLILSAALVLIVPLAAALRGRAADAHDPLTQEQTLIQALFEAGRHRSYILLVAGFYVCGFQVQFVATHLPNFLAIEGVPELAGIAIGIIGFFNFLGTLFFGWLGGLFSKKLVLSGLYFSRSVVFTIFLVLPISKVSIILFAAALGFLWLGTVPLTTGLVVSMFGPRYLTTLASIVFLSHQLGSFTGSWIGGVLFDATGSYDAMWMGAIGMGLFAAIVHLPISEKRVHVSA